MRRFGEIWEREGYERVRYVVLCEGERNGVPRPLEFENIFGSKQFKK